MIKDTTTQGFRQDVMQESMNQPVLVDFWAPWCGPCKQLTPVLEKVVKAAKGKVKLVKMNIDEHPQIAGQLGVKSIPPSLPSSAASRSTASWRALPESQSRASSSGLSAAWVRIRSRRSLRRRSRASPRAISARRPSSSPARGGG